MDKITVLHLTDIHIGYNFMFQEVEELAHNILNEYEKNETSKIDLILISGDIFDGRAFNGVKSDDEILKDGVKFFETLLERINKDKNNLTKEAFLFLPGNHDLNRETVNDQFERYRKFLIYFYGNKEDVYKLYDEKYLYRYKIFEESKIIVVGLNSCKIEKEQAQYKDTEWIENIELKGLKLEKLKIDQVKKQITKIYKAKIEEKWYDYGYISLQQFEAVWREIREKTQASSDEYNIVVSFHHHIIPFPEIWDKTGDVSLIKNFEQVIERLQTNNVKLVLHGHKHLPIIRPLATDKFLQDPQSLIFISAGGNIGSKRDLRHFQVVDIYSKSDANNIAQIKKYELKGVAAGEHFVSEIPPATKDEFALEKSLETIVKSYNLKLYEEYRASIFDKNPISREKGIETLILCISNVLTSFKSINDRLFKNPIEALMVLLFIHFRTLALFRSYSSLENQNLDKDLDEIVSFFKAKTNINNNFIDKTFHLLKETHELESDTLYNEIYKTKLDSSSKKIISYGLISMFFTDLFLSLSQFADKKYKDIEHKINIKLNPGQFHKQIPSNHIFFHTEGDRRAVIVKLKSSNPTAHKIAVLIIKDFEIKLAKYEKEFDEIGLKTYYLIPKIEHDIHDYELDDYNFEAYIPKLLPLLIGENIYKSKEVFARELIQNSIDAILLRVNLDKSKTNVDNKIYLQFDKETPAATAEYNRKQPVFNLKLIDFGVGMDESHFERYFIHLGRSFYTSTEYNDLMKEKHLTYKPISKFGIGFLTSFLVSREVRIQTRSFRGEESGLDVYIPNHEGCFFIKRNENLKSGNTIITLYEDPLNPIKPNKIIDYIKEYLIDLQLEIVITGKDKQGKMINERVKPHKLRHELLAVKDNNPFFFIPLCINGIEQNARPMEKLFEFSFGVLFQFVSSKTMNYKHNDNGSVEELNAGISLDIGSKYFRSGAFKPYCFNVFINYPPNFIELDVSREKINDFKPFGAQQFKFNDKQFILIMLTNLMIQVKQWLVKKNEIKLSLYNSHQIAHFFIINSNNTINCTNFAECMSCIKITNKNGKINFLFVPIAEYLTSMNSKLLSKNEIYIVSTSIVPEGKIREYIESILNFIVEALKIDKSILRKLPFKDITRYNYEMIQEYEYRTSNLTEQKIELDYKRLMKPKNKNLSLFATEFLELVKRDELFLRDYLHRFLRHRYDYKSQNKSDESYLYLIPMFFMFFTLQPQMFSYKEIKRKHYFSINIDTLNNDELYHKVNKIFG